MPAPEDITDVDEFTTPVQAPGQGEDGNDVTFKRGLQQLANRTFWLKQRLGVEGGVTAWAAASSSVSTFSASGGGAALGNGTLQATYRFLGPDTIQITVNMLVGSTTNFGSGNAQWSLPGGFSVDATKLANGMVGVSNVYLADSSTPANNRGGRVDVASGQLVIVPEGVSGNLTGTVPFTWATGDRIVFSALVPVVTS